MLYEPSTVEMRGAMAQRVLWTLERICKQPLSGLDTADDFTRIVLAERLPSIMPADWIVATLQMDEEGDGASIHESAHGWTLRIKRIA
jgi:hypothetical protein